MFDIKKAFDTIVGYTIGSKNEWKKKMEGEINSKQE